MPGVGTFAKVGLHSGRGPPMLPGVGMTLNRLTVAAGHARATTVKAVAGTAAAEKARAAVDKARAGETAAVAEKEEQVVPALRTEKLWGVKCFPRGARIFFAAADKVRAAEISAAAETEERRETGTYLDAWLRDMCGIVDAKERAEVVDLFADPRYRVDSMPTLFALKPSDLDTILAPLSLGTRRLVKCAWVGERPRGGAAVG
ncbi:hypothetical protein T484DRAFT_1780293 [Baffinella frigidus]|nr:hypothetical protein T484DRAFT_1780293 [Cryptophyta sp. CCMP2293]